MKKYLARAKRTINKSVLKTVDSVFQTNYFWNYSFQINGYHETEFQFEKSEIAFVHVPKTGGTSFYKLLETDVHKRFINLKVHRPISLLCAPSSFNYITIIREPIERVWSLYQMVLRKPKGYPYQKYAKKSLECFLQNCWEANDLTCRYYTGEIKQKPNQDTMKKALVNLKLFYKVILFDTYADEVNTFLQDHQITYTNIPHERKSKYDIPTASEKEIMERHNKFDKMLFEHWSKERSCLKTPKTPMR